jgi:L-asparaginase/Glu-tRNA(Gln) amidotransferase subunit D
MAKPKIVVFSGPRSTIANNPALVTSSKGRNADDPQLDGRFDHLVAQTLHEPVRVKIKKFSAHPLEEDAKAVYHDDGKDYWEVELSPEDGAYLLPYVARRADGSPDGTPFEDGDARNADIGFGGRQSFFPDAARLFADIDRTINGRDADGGGSTLDKLADYDFVRALPPAGYTQQGEVAGQDFWPYSPRPIGKFPPMHMLARVANTVQKALDTGEYAGAIWLEGSPHLEETLYWLSLVIDTNLPFAGISAQRMHGEISNDGDRNIIDATHYVVSSAGAGLGAVGIVDEQIFAARNFKKGDARPGGYLATGGHGGVLGSTKTPIYIWFRPNYQHTSTSDVALPKLPATVVFQAYGDSQATESVRIKDDDGSLRGDVIAPVHMVKYGHYMAEEDTNDPDVEVDIIARIDRAIAQEAAGTQQFHGFVMESAAGSGSALPSQTAALAIASFNGMPVVRVGRGDHAGPIVTTPNDLTIEGSNLDAIKARVLLRAAMLKLGRLPKARDPRKPTAQERQAVVDAIAKYQAIFVSH